jgi:hypothetical protein
MYNKLFTKILDSTIWLESTPTRIVWLTFIAAMDESGYCPFAAIGNVAGRARVTIEEAADAVRCLESPDTDSGDKSNDGRRIERVPGGWMVLNAAKYRELVTRVNVREQTRQRVQKHRDSKRNAPVTVSNEKLTPSDTDTDTVTETDVSQNQDQNLPPRENPRREFSTAFPQTLDQKRTPAQKENTWKPLTS